MICIFIFFFSPPHPIPIHLCFPQTAVVVFRFSISLAPRALDVHVEVHGEDPRRLELPRAQALRAPLAGRRLGVGRLAPRSLQDKQMLRDSTSARLFDGWIEYRINIRKLIETGDCEPQRQMEA